MSEVLSQLGWVRGLPGDRRAQHPLTAPPQPRTALRAAAAVHAGGPVMGELQVSLHPVASSVTPS